MSQLLKTAARSVRRDWVSYVGIVLGACVQMLLITQPLSFLITNLFPDDAFYYFQIARHIAEGAGSTFDGTNITNGYHPLWLLVLVPIFSFFGNGGVADVAPLYAVLSLSVLINLGTALIVFAVVSRITQSRYARAFAVLLWSLNPFIIFETLNGLETSLALFFLALFFFMALRLESSSTRYGYALAGLIGGLLILARIDMVFFVGAFVLWTLLHQGWRKGISNALITGVIAGAFLFGWMLYNLLGFGMVMTSASQANPLVNHALVVQDNGASIYEQIKAPVYFMVLFAKDILLRTGAPWLLFFFLGAAIAFWSEGRAWFSDTRRRFPVIFALLAGFVVLFIVDAGIRFTGRSWYFISFNIFLVLAGASLFRIFARRDRRFIAILVLVSIAVLSSFFIGWYGTIRNQFANQTAMYDMANYLNQEFAPGTPVGVFNAGIIGYFSHAQIINLDGLVNNTAYHAMTKQELWSYIEESGITYLADFDIYFTYRYRSFLDVSDFDAQVKEIHRIYPENGIHGADSIVLYEVQDSE